jgi:hypothetical protein
MQNSVMAWQLLQRLSQAEAGVILNEVNSRYYFLFHCRVMDPVDACTLQLLQSDGLVQRERSAIPIYTISNRGREALQQRQSGLSEPVPEDASAG